ncbi:MAG: stealth family protein [Thermomonas sp.]
MDARDDNAIDAVVAWVDGSDPAHHAKLEAYLASIGGKRPTMANPTRFSADGELDYCIASLLRHAPWLRRIWIVTDAQVPELARRIAGTPLSERIRVVDHREIFAGFERYLPTFNARAISAMLWRIPGLAGRFVYFNDDFMLLRPVDATDFFRGDGVVLRGRWRPQSAHSPLRRLAAAWKSLRGIDDAARASVRHSQELAARLAGFERRYFALKHTPYPFRRSTMQAFFEAHPAVLEDCARHRLRAMEQPRSECLSTHLEIALGGAVFDDRLRVVELKPRTQSLRGIERRMARADADESFAFACVQSLDAASDAVRGAILAWLDRRIGRLDAAFEA